MTKYGLVGSSLVPTQCVLRNPNLIKQDMDLNQSLEKAVKLLLPARLMAKSGGVKFMAKSLVQVKFWI